MKKRFILLVASILVLTLMVVGCTSPSTTPAPESEKEQGQGDAASKYPEKPITIIVTYTAGGNVDVLARLLAKHAEEFLGQPLVIKNVDGGGGEVGVMEALNAPADGYTIFSFGTAHVTLTLMREAGYHPIDDISPICLAVSDPRVFAVRADDERFIEEGSFVQYAKDNPGKLTIGTAGAGSSGHLLVNYMEGALGIKTQLVHFGGVSETKTAVLGGHVDITSDTYGSIINLVNEGTMRIIAVAADERLPDLPDCPTFKELGVDIKMASNRGYAASKDVPDEIIAKLADAFEKAMAKPEYQEELKNIGQPFKFMGVEDWTDFVKYEYDIYSELIE